MTDTFMPFPFGPKPEHIRANLLKLLDFKERGKLKDKDAEKRVDQTIANLQSQLRELGEL